MAAIGGLILMIGAKSGQLDSGLASAERKVRESAGKMQKALTSSTSGFASGLLGEVKSAFASIPFAGGALGSIFGGGLFGKIHDVMRGVVETSRAADRLGVSYATLAGLEYMGGDAAEAMTKGLFHVNAKLGEASLGSRAAQHDFERFGMDWRALANLSADDRIGAFADQIKALKDPMLQFAAAKSLMGRGGVTAMPFLLQGKEGFDSAKHNAVVTGNALTDADVAKIHEANESLKFIEKTMEGIGKQIAVGVAPYIEMISKGFRNWVEASGGIGPAMKQLFEIIGRGVISLLRGFSAFEAKLMEIVGSTEELTSGLKKLTTTSTSDLLSEAGERLAPIDAQEASKKFGKKGIGAALSGLGVGTPVDTRSDIDKWIDELEKKILGLGDGMNAAAKPVDRLQTLFLSIADFDAELDKSIFAIGKTADELQYLQRVADGATSEMLAETRAKMIQKSALEELNRLTVKADINRFSESLNKIFIGADALASKGQALSDADLGGSLLALMDQFDKTGGGEPKLAPNAEAGTSSAQHIINQAMAGTSGNDPVERFNRMIQIMEEQGKQRQQEAERMIQAMKQGQIKLAGAPTALGVH